MTLAALMFYYFAGLSLTTLATCHTIALITQLRDRRAASQETTPLVSTGSEYVATHCGVATVFGGLTSDCTRRRGHDGRCVSELEVETMTMVKRAESVAPTDLQVDVAALGRHVDACPSRLTDDGVLTAEEQRWLIQMRLMVEAMVGGERFSEWGETRG